MDIVPPPIGREALAGCSGRRGPTSCAPRTTRGLRFAPPFGILFRVASLSVTRRFDHRRASVHLHVGIIGSCGHCRDDLPWCATTARRATGRVIARPRDISVCDSTFAIANYCRVYTHAGEQQQRGGAHHRHRGSPHRLASRLHLSNLEITQGRLSVLSRHGYLDLSQRMHCPAGIGSSDIARSGGGSISVIFA